MQSWDYMIAPRGFVALLTLFMAMFICRLDANLGPITDLEVIKTLERRGADKTWARKREVPSERQVQPATAQGV